VKETEKEESGSEKAAREKFDAGQALLNTSRGDKAQVRCDYNSQIFYSSPVP
jgi:hypothetical protein